MPPKPTDRLFEVQVLLTAIIAGWAFVALIHGQTFAASPNLGKLFSVNTWTAVFLVIAVLSTIGLVQKRRFWRIIVTQLLSITHLAVAMLFIIAGDISTGTTTYAILATAAVYVVWKER